MIVVDRGQRHLLDVRSEIAAAKIENVELLFVSRRKSNLFLVVDVRGSSKLNQGRGHCGAGEEADLLWINLRADW